jgi:hypothetical protein
VKGSVAGNLQPIAVELFGRVHGITINASAPGLTFKADDGSISATLDVVISNSSIKVRWFTEDYSRDKLRIVYDCSKKITTALVDLIAFRHGCAASVVIDKYRERGGFEDGISVVQPLLSELSTLINDDNGLHAVFSLLLSEPRLMVVMDDLISGLGSHDHKIINCARSVEAIRQLIGGYSLEPKAQWPVFNDALNLDRSYSDTIMDQSKDPRHGRMVPASDEAVAEIVKRTWNIFYRYFEYKLGGGKKLDPSRFPLLRG